jgi:hypothetical protein
MFFNLTGTAKKNLDKLIMFLKYVYGFFFVVVGVDKFFNVITFWEKYFSVAILNMLPATASAFVMLVGLIEITLGVLVLTKWTKIGAHLMTGWIGLVVLNLLTMGSLYLDIAARDLLIGVGTCTLGCLIAIRDEM